MAPKGTRHIVRQQWWEMTIQLVKRQLFEDLRDCWKDTDWAIMGLRCFIIFLVDRCHVRKFRISTKWRKIMPVSNAKQDSRKHAICGGMHRFVREKWPRWCAEESKSVCPKLSMKKRFMAKGVCVEGGQLVGTQGPTEGCAYPSSNVWPPWEKDKLQDIQWMVFVQKQTRCFSSMAATGRAVQGVFYDGEWKWLFLKNKARQERADRRDVVCTTVGKKAGDSWRGFWADWVLGALLQRKAAVSDKENGNFSAHHRVWFWGVAG